LQTPLHSITEGVFGGHQDSWPQHTTIIRPFFEGVQMVI